MSLVRSLALLSLLSFLALAAGCAVEDSGSSMPDTLTPDAGACYLDSEPVDCTDDAPCLELCATSYCREYAQIGRSVCTNNCATAEDCPDGWRCNKMGRCRPPGVTE